MEHFFINELFGQIAPFLIMINAVFMLAGGIISDRKEKKKDLEDPEKPDFEEIIKRWKQAP